MEEKIKKWKASLFETNLSKIILIIGLIIIAILIFLSGEAVGYHKAGQSYRFGDNYNRIFGGRKMGVGMGMPPFPEDNDFLSSHGAGGKIVKISLPEIFIEGDNGIEKIITLNTMSLIKEFRETIASTTLKVGDEIVVLGTPGTNGEIKAELIRVITPVINQ